MPDGRLQAKDKPVPAISPLLLLSTRVVTVTCTRGRTRPVLLQQYLTYGSVLAPQ